MKQLLEDLYNVELVKQKSLYALLLGIGYAIIGIGCAVLLFPEDPAIVAVAFTAILFLPLLRQVLITEEDEECAKARIEGADKFSIIQFFKDHNEIFKIYLFYFLGVLFVFSFFALVLPNLATNYIFKNQLEVMYGTAVQSGKAMVLEFDSNLFTGILLNNFIVMILCFITAFIIGDGAVFLITWNASVWGTIFGNLAQTAAIAAGKNPILYFILVIVVVLPHMLLEAFAYFSSAGAGAIVSRGLIKEQFMSPQFKRLIKGTVLLLLVAAAFIIVGALVETYVLENVDVYRAIIQQSFG